MPVYSLHLLVEKITATEPLQGVATAAYRVSLDYVPASQVYGLVLKSLVLETLDPGKTTLDILEDVLREKDCVEKVSPAYPYSEDVQEMVLAREDLDTLSRLEGASEPSVFWGLVEVPKPVKKLLAGRGIECERLPLTLLVVVGSVLLDDGLARWLEDVCRSTRLVFGKRYRVGIAFDRVRKTALHGYFYAYQYTFTEHPHYIATISTRRPLEGLEHLLKALGVGYKKSMSSSISDIVLSRTRATAQVQNALKRLALDVLEAVGREGGKGKLRLLVYAYDNSIFPLKRLKGEIVELWVNRRDRVYLEITNRFYVVNMYSYTIASKGSYMVLEYDNMVDAVDDIEAVYEKAPVESFRVEKVVDHGLLPVFDWERSLVLDKVFKSLQNIAVIPYLEVERGEARHSG